MLKWVFERCEGAAKAVETPIGNLPAKGDLDVDGLDVSEQISRSCCASTSRRGSRRCPASAVYETFEGRVPKELVGEVER